MFFRENTRIKECKKEFIQIAEKENRLFSVNEVVDNILDSIKNRSIKRF
jgi:hypothetical protein